MTVYPVIPRFVVNIRELYDSDGLSKGIGDTGFGISSSGRNMAVWDTSVSVIAFI